MPTKILMIASLLGSWCFDARCGAPTKPEGTPESAAVVEATRCRTNQLVLHFRDAPLETVLEYFAEAAGFKVALEATPRGKVNVWSDQPLSAAEALDLLNSVLIANDLAAIRDGRTLTLVNRDEAKTRGIPVRLGADPEAIPRTDEIVTQIIPLRFVEADQLARNLALLISPRTTMTADESANSLVITDTQANIRRLAQIIKAMEAGAEGVTLVKVFRLQNADAQETADLITGLFPNSDRSGENQTPFQFQAPFPGPGGPGEGPPDMPVSGNSQSGSNQRSRKAAQVTARADLRTSSVVISAPENSMSQIEGIIASLDASPARKQRLAVYELKNSSPQQMAKVLQTLFQKSANSNNRNSSTETDPLETRASQQSQLTSSAASATLGGNASGPGGQGGGGGGGGSQ